MNRNIKARLVKIVLLAWLGTSLVWAGSGSKVDRFSSNPHFHEIDAKNQVLKQKQISLRLTSLPDLRLETIKAKLYSLEKFRKPFVLLFLSTQCPVANQYIPRLNRLHQTYPDTELFGIYSNQEDSVDIIAQHVQKMKITFPVVKDFDSKLAQQIGASMTPQAFLVELPYAGARVNPHFHDVDQFQVIVAGSGRKNTRTGDTLCDPNHPIMLEQLEFPEDWLTNGDDGLDL